MRRTFRSLVLFAVLAFVGSGCAVTLKNSFLDQAKAEGWTKQQQYAALHWAYRLKCTAENQNGQFDINYCNMLNELATSVHAKRLDDLNAILDYNNKDWAGFIKEFDLREELEREERIFKATHGRLQLRDNFNKFKSYMGERDSYSHNHGDQVYSASRVFVEDVFGAYPFASTRVDESRQAGTLKEIQRFTWADKRVLDSKEPDPSDPEDPNKFIWRTREDGIEFVAYKIITSERPNNNNPDYIEGTRFSIEKGVIKKESKPALKVFTPTSGYGAVLVVDKDREGKIGYMLPDFVERLGGFPAAWDLMGENILSMVFFEDQKDRRVKPKDPPPIMVEIAPVGRNKVDVWEINPNGWSVPFNYRNDQGSNFIVIVKVRGSEKHDFNQASMNKQIEYVAKQWSGSGNVKEYFKPKPPFDATNVASVNAYDKRLEVITNDGDPKVKYVTPGSNLVIQDKPFALTYVDSENQEWYLADEDGDGKFEKRRQGSK